MTTTVEAGSRLLDRVQKLLAKAEDPGVTEPEREALVGKATELMAKYGIDKALLDATRTDADAPIDRPMDIDNPWARVKMYLLAGIADAMRCQTVVMPTHGDAVKVHVFGYRSDIERAELLYTSVLLQMAHGLARQNVPPQYRGRQAMAWRRSWMLGFSTSVISRVREAEDRAAAQAEAQRPWYGPGTEQQTGTALVLRSRAARVEDALREAYPTTRTSRMSYSGRGFAGGKAAGQAANLGGTGVGRRTAGALR